MKEFENRNFLIKFEIEILSFLFKLLFFTLSTISVPLLSSFKIVVANFLI